MADVEIASQLLSAEDFGVRATATQNNSAGLLLSYARSPQQLTTVTSAGVLSGSDSRSGLFPNAAIPLNASSVQKSTQHQQQPVVIVPTAGRGVTFSSSSVSRRSQVISPAKVVQVCSGQLPFSSPASALFSLPTQQQQRIQPLLSPLSLFTSNATTILGFNTSDHGSARPLVVSNASNIISSGSGSFSTQFVPSSSTTPTPLLCPLGAVTPLGQLGSIQAARHHQVSVSQQQQVNSLLVGDLQQNALEHLLNTGYLNSLSNARGSPLILGSGSGYSTGFVTYNRNSAGANPVFNPYVATVLPKPQPTMVPSPSQSPSTVQQQGGGRAVTPTSRPSPSILRRRPALDPARSPAHNLGSLASPVQRKLAFYETTGSRTQSGHYQQQSPLPMSSLADSHSQSSSSTADESSDNTQTGFVEMSRDLSLDELSNESSCTTVSAASDNGGQRLGSATPPVSPRKRPRKQLLATTAEPNCRQLLKTNFACDESFSEIEQKMEAHHSRNSPDLTQALVIQEPPRSGPGSSQPAFRGTPAVTRTYGNGSRTKRQKLVDPDPQPALPQTFPFSPHQAGPEGVGILPETEGEKETVTEPHWLPPSAAEVVKPTPAKPQRLSILQTYGGPLECRLNHFLRYEDVKQRDEKHLSITDLVNNQYILQRIKGWKIYMMDAQFEDIDSVEQCNSEIVDSCLSALSSFGASFSKTAADKEQLNRIEELLKGNQQRSKVLQEQVDETRQHLLKLLEHRTQVENIVEKYVSKRRLRRRDRQISG